MNSANNIDPVFLKARSIQRGDSSRRNDFVSSSSSVYTNLLFLVISFGYMLPWTSLGSLISYYKQNFGANFYVKIYFCYYLPGLPVALFQRATDEGMDLYLGSYYAYLVRGVLAFTVLIVLLLLMINNLDQFQLLIYFTLLGIFGWFIHGSASMLAAMHSPSAIAMLQTGFRCPEIYVIAAVSYLHIGRASEIETLNEFFIISAVIVGVGLVAWFLIIQSPESLICFEAKDLASHGSGTRGLRGTRGGVGEASPLLGRKKRRKEAEREADEDEEEGGTRNGMQSSFAAAAATVVITNETAEEMREEAIAFFLPQEEDPDRTEAVKEALWPLCVALLITMWCSIFLSSFFAHVNSPNGLEIEQILYFTRLFSDLFGRPLTRLPRPYGFQSNNQLLVAACLRVALMVLFFVYILVPGFPQSDLFICSLVAVFSILSGYISVLIYEFAAAQCSSKAEQAKVTAVLNVCFQLAAFFAVILSVAVTSLGWIT